jgi:hypothetical protein
MWYYMQGAPALAGVIIVAAIGGLGYALVTHLVH